MRISHRDLDVCGRDPGQWVRDKLQPGLGRPSWGYDAVLKLGHHKLHKGESLDVAREHIEKFFERSDRLKNAARILSVLNRLTYYGEWLRDSGTVVADSRRNLVLSGFGFLEFGGQIDRVDFTADGHRGVLLGTPSPDWQEQLRMPLLQLALATTYGIPTQEVAVGVQDLDGSGLAVRTYSEAELAAAQNEFRSLSQRVKQIRDGIIETG